MILNGNDTSVTTSPVSKNTRGNATRARHSQHKKKLQKFTEGEVVHVKLV